MTRTSSLARILCVAVCLAMVVASTTLATAPSSATRIKRVRGVVGYRRQLPEENGEIHTTPTRKAKEAKRTYPSGSKYQLSAKNDSKEDSSRSAVDECLEGSRSGSTSKGKKSGSRARSGEESNSGGKKSGSRARSGEESKSGKTRKGSKVKGDNAASRSGKAAKTKECKSAKSGVPSREYPPPGMMAEDGETGGSKSASGASVMSASGASSNSGASKKAAKASGCARSGNASKQASKSGTRTRGLKGSGSTGSRSVDDECVEETGNSAKSAHGGREYAPENVAGAGGTASAYQDDGVVVGSAVEASRSIECSDIAMENGPTSDTKTRYTISADMQVQTSDITLGQFYQDLQSYLQQEVAMTIAGCSGLDDSTSGFITNVLFATPVENGECASTRSRRRAISATARQYLPETATEGEYLVDGDGNGDMAMDEASTTYDGPSTGESESRADDEGTCHRTEIAVDVYHYMDLTDETSIQADLENSLLGADLEGLVAVSNSNVEASSSTTQIAEARSTVQADNSSTNKKIGFSMGVLGVILLSLIAMKVVFSRKKRAEAKKYAEFGDDGATDDGDDTSFVYPTEDELLGPEFGDLDLDEANQGATYAHPYPYASSQSKGSTAYILDDLHQEAMSVETPSLASREQLSFRQVPPTPDMRRDCC